MASNLIIVVFLVFVSLSLTSAYSISTRNAASKQDDESYVIDQESLMVVVKDVVKGRLLARVAVNTAVSKSALGKGLKWFWKRKSPKWKPKSPPKSKEKSPSPPTWKQQSPPKSKEKSPSPTTWKQQSSSPTWKKKSSIMKSKIKKIGLLSVGAFAGIIVAAVVVTIGIIFGICFLLGCLCFSRKAKKVQSAAEAEQETATDKTNDSSKPQTSKTEVV